QAEFLYDRVEETIRIDFKEELDFLQAFDAAIAGVREIVDMPDRRLDLLVRICLRGGGRLSKSKRGLFAELTDDEIKRIESAIQEVIGNASGLLSDDHVARSNDEPTD